MFGGLTHIFGLWYENVAKQLVVECKTYIPPYHPQSKGRIEELYHFKGMYI